MQLFAWATVALTATGALGSDSFQHENRNYKRGSIGLSNDGCQSSLDQTTKNRLLSFHNDARQLAKAEPLVWDDALHCSSQEWANRCVFEHSRSPTSGENIGCGYGNGYEPLTALKDWWNEYKDYNLGDAFSEQAGHYTQMVWKNTTAIGCGITACTASQMGMNEGGTTPSQFVVCQYKAPGNVQGQFRQSVALPQSVQAAASLGNTALKYVGSNVASKEDESNYDDSDKDAKSYGTTIKADARKSHWSPHRPQHHADQSASGTGSSNKSKGSVNYGVSDVNYGISVPSKGSNNGNTNASPSGKTDDCKEGSKSGTSQDGSHWTYSWKSWSTSSATKRSIDAEPKSLNVFASPPVKREPLSFLSRSRLHKKRRTLRS
ncbi:hypothetical protein CBS101457_003904 [Exobasidium rhododendri]|nr:hypothetical protein CBS101457_003904 [Exobasidium rhododendri]